ncbi:MAG: tail fiber domain-containing protein [Bacteroidota bacterium]
MKNYILFFVAVLFTATIHAQNVGINTTNPEATLDVNGSLKVGNLVGTDTQMVVTDPSGHFSVRPLAVPVLQDADGDTKINTEKFADEDMIRFDVQGQESFSFFRNANGIPNLRISNVNGNMAVGTDAGALTSTGINNLMIGHQAGASNTTGFSNVFVGLESGQSSVGAGDNTFVGTGSGKNNISGGENVFMGSFTGLENTTGSFNTFLGRYSGQLNETGSSNTSIGWRAGGDNIAGSGNVFIGSEAGVNELGSNKLYINNNGATAPLVYGEFGANKLAIGTSTVAADASLMVNGNVRIADDADMYGLDELFGFNDLRLYGDPNIGPNNQADMVIGANGNVGIGIGNNVPTQKLQVVGKILIGTAETLEDAGFSTLGVDATIRPIADNTYDLGSASFRWDDVFATNGTINTSDRRDKQNIQDLDYGLEQILQLRPVRYEWKGQPEKGEKLGLIAQELETVIHEVVKTHDLLPTEEGGTMENVELERLGVYYSDLIPVLIKGMQEQQVIIEKLEQRLETLENQN